MPPQPRCSECGAPLGRVNARTCSTRCRSARSRRIKRQRRNAGKATGNPEYVDTIAAAVAAGTKDIAHGVMQEELRPIVRESMTEDVLRAVHSMIGMAPQVVAKLAEDVQSDDPVIRQRAYDLWLRYTIGNKSVAPAAQEEEKTRPMVINFDMPRPGSDPAPVEAAAVELRRCDMCGEEKSEFAATSDRCTDCYAGFRDEVEGRFGGE